MLVTLKSIFGEAYKISLRKTLATQVVSLILVFALSRAQQKVVRLSVWEFI